jgi:hypothetical protein
MKVVNWQIISRDNTDIIAVLKDEQRYLSTVELIYAVDKNKYETALYDGKKFIVLNRYATKDKALAGHKKLSKKYGFTDEF